MESSNQVHLGNLWKDWTERERVRVREKRRSTVLLFFWFCVVVWKFLFFFFLVFVVFDYKVLLHYKRQGSRVTTELNSTCGVLLLCTFWYFWVLRGIWKQKLYDTSVQIIALLVQTSSRFLVLEAVRSIFRRNKRKRQILLKVCVIVSKEMKWL